MKFAMLLIALVLTGCASQHTIVASTPRTVEVHGVAFSGSDNQKAFDVAEAECAKNGRHAALTRSGGSRIDARWTFDCVQ